MDCGHFDAIARLVSTQQSRRSAVVVLLGAALLGHDPDAALAKRRKRKRRGRGGDDDDNRGETPLCFQGSPCLIKQGANLRDCNFFNSDDLRNGNCQGCVLSGANLAGADLSGASLQGAILGDACLVDADLSGADVDGVLFDEVIFCRTIMPDGSENNSGCERATRCCQTDRPQGGGGGQSCHFDDDCGTNETCVGEQCHPCIVCASGCRFTAVQVAVDLANPGAIVVLCPGEYKDQVFINKDLMLTGVSDPAITKLVGTAPARIGDAVLTVSAGANVIVRNIAISGGRSLGRVGGGISNFGSLRLERVKISDCNNTGLGGGGIFNLGGGAKLVVKDAEVAANTATNGGGIHNDGGSVTLRRCDVSENIARSHGGGIENVNGGVLDIEEDTLIAANVAHTGGGIDSDHGTVTIIDSLVRVNKAIVQGPAGGDGGGILSHATRLVLAGSTSIEHNTAEGGTGSGGGVFNSEGTVEFTERASITLNTPDDCVNFAGGTGCPA